MKTPAPRYDLWIVAVPIVFAIVLGYALRQLSLWFAMTLHVGQESLFLVEAGPFCLRTILLALLVATVCYSGLWSVVHVREVVKLGRRGIPSEPFGKAVAVLLFLAGSIYGTYLVQRLPSADEYLRDADVRLREGNIIYYQSAVRMGIPGIDELCLRLRDDQSADLAFFGAAGAYHRGDRSAKTRGILHDRIEALKAAALSGSKEVRNYEWVTRLVRTPAPTGMWDQELDTGLSRDSPFWGWWEQAEPSF